ncbi:hypothetical protein ACLB2K_075234 [Fragaria x ananassa]
MKKRKQLPTNKEVNIVKKKFRSPVICKDFEELLRLMKRDRPGKCVRDASGVRSGGDAQSSVPDGRERRDVRTLKTMRTSASERIRVYTHNVDQVDSVLLLGFDRVSKEAISYLAATCSYPQSWYACGCECTFHSGSRKCTSRNEYVS